MTKNFSNVMDYKVVANNEVKMFNNVDDVVDYVVMMMKKHPNRAIYVNDMGIRIEKVSDIFFVFLRDSDMNLIRGYAMGKIKRGMDKAVAYVMESVNNNNNNMEENNMNTEMMNALVNDFNDYVVAKVKTDYNNAVDSTIDAYSEVFVDGENEYVCGGFDYDYDIRKMWVDYVLNEREVYDISKNDLYDYYDENRDMFISEDDLDEIVEELDGTDDVGDGECLVWVKNPYYVEQEQVNNDSPYLDDVDRVVKVIEDYVNNYTMSYLDNYGGCVVCVPWDKFNEDDMKMLIEDADFEEYVVDVLMQKDIKDVLVYDDGVYVSVDAKKFDKSA